MNVRLSTSHGDIEIALDTERAPLTADNFVRYVRAGHYDGTLFHRVIPGFMIQGGGFEPGMRQRPAETRVTNEADNGLANEVGTVAMARTQDPHSASAQFFINVADNAFLNHRDKSRDGWGYCVFGRVTSGMEVVQRIENSATGARAGHQDVPERDVLITEATVVDD